MTGHGLDFIESVLFASGNDQKEPARQDPGSDIVASALLEDVAPTLYYLLRKKRIMDALSAADMQGLARFFETNLVFNLGLRQELITVLKRFNALGVPHILLKGIALAEFYYPSLSMRRMTDVDILIHEENLPEIDACLKDMGYAPADSDVHTAMQNPAGYLASLEYHRKEGLPPLHIHWRLINTSVPATAFAPFQSMERLWLRATPAQMDGVATRILCTEHLLLHLCEHALRINHSFNRLILVYDIVTVLRCKEKPVAWDALIEEAGLSHLEIFLYCSLQIVRSYAPDAVPETVIARIRPNRLTWGQRLFLRLQLQGLRIRGSSYLIYLSLNRGFLAKATFLFRTVIPPQSIQRQRRREGEGPVAVHLYILRVWEIVRHLVGVMPKLLGRR